MNRSDVFRFMVEERYGVVSSLAEDGTPQSALVGIAATPELDVIFDTVKTSRKYGNLKRRPQCSLVIGLSHEQTLQLEGLAEELLGRPLERHLDVYFAAWPECRNHLVWPGITHFVVRPRWIRYSDYRSAPALIEEFAIPNFT